MHFPGKKKKELFDELIKQFISENISDLTYIEPFGGTFAVNEYLSVRPKLSIYNDVNDYMFDLVDADIVEHLDFKEIIEKYDSMDSIFYLDPPYYNKEYLYGFQYHVHEPLKLALDNNMIGKWILSYEDCKYIRKLYPEKEYNITKYSGTNPIFKKEIIITKK